MAQCPSKHPTNNAQHRDIHELDSDAPSLFDSGLKANIPDYRLYTHTSKKKGIPALLCCLGGGVEGMLRSVEAKIFHNSRRIGKKDLLSEKQPAYSIGK